MVFFLILCSLVAQAWLVPIKKMSLLGIFPDGKPRTKRLAVYATISTSKSYRIHRPDEYEDFEDIGTNWEQKFAFYAYTASADVPAETKASSVAHHVYRHKSSLKSAIFLTKKNPVEVGWEFDFSFWAYSAEMPKSRKYWIAESVVKTLDDKKYVVSITEAGTSAAEWDAATKIFFWAYAPSPVSESMRYALNLINTEGTQLPGYNIRLDEYFDGCDENEGRSKLLEAVTDTPTKYAAVLGFYCAADEQIAKMSPLMRLVNHSLSPRAILQDYENQFSSYVSENDMTKAMMTVIKDECRWHKIGIVVGSPGHRVHAKKFKTTAAAEGVIVGGVFEIFNEDDPSLSISAWNDAKNEDTRILIFLGSTEQIKETLCDQVREKRAGLVILTTAKPISNTDLFWRNTGDEDCPDNLMDDAAETMLFFDDRHFRADDAALGCFAKTVNQYKAGWANHVTANSITDNEMVANSADVLCAFVKNLGSFQSLFRRYSIHDITLNHNLASAYCVERLGTLAIVDEDTTDANMDKIQSLVTGETANRSAYLINAKRISAGKWMNGEFKILTIPDVMWSPMPAHAGLGDDNKDYVALRYDYQGNGAIKLFDVGDAIGLSGDDAYGFICEYAPITDIVNRKSLETFEAYNDHMSTLTFEGLTGSIIYGNMKSPQTAVNKKQVQSGAITDIGEYSLVNSAWTYGDDKGLKWLTGSKKSCFTGGEIFPTCAKYKLPVFDKCVVQPCGDREGMEGIVPDCQCMPGWFNTTAALLRNVITAADVIEGTECGNCTEEIDGLFCPENLIELDAYIEDAIDPELLVRERFERKASVTLIVPASVRSVSLNIYFSEAFKAAAEAVYGRNVTVDVNYITTSGRRRRLTDEYENVGVEIYSDVDLRTSYQEDPEQFGYWDDEDLALQRFTPRGLQSVLHTVVMYKMNVMRLFMDDVLSDEDGFDEEMLTKLTKSIEDDAHLKGYSVVMVDFPAPEPTWANTTSIECPGVNDTDESLRVWEIVGLALTGVFGLMALVGGVFGVKKMRDEEMACFKKKERKQKIKPTYVTQVDALTDAPGDPALALADDPNKSMDGIEAIKDDDMKISDAAPSDMDAMSNVEAEEEGKELLALENNEASVTLEENNNNNPNAATEDVT